MSFPSMQSIKGFAPLHNVYFSRDKSPCSAHLPAPLSAYNIIYSVAEVATLNINKVRSLNKVVDVCEVSSLYLSYRWSVDVVGAVQYTHTVTSVYLHYLHYRYVSSLKC